MLVVVPSSFVLTLRCHRGVMKFTVAGTHEHPAFTDLACMFFHPQAVD